MSSEGFEAFYSGEPTFNFSSGSNGTAGEPAFLSEFQNPQIAADVANALGSNDTLSYHGMLDILREAAVDGMTASKFGDLETLVSLMNTPNGISTSAYVEAISHSLIDGDPANAIWTGGGKPQALGDLSATSTQAQVDELIGKWFLGTDLPDANYKGTTNGTYEVVKGPLFADGGPTYHDINQGSAGDCYFLSTLAEVALKDPSAIESMITNNGNGTYGVRFFLDGKAVYETVNNELPVLDHGKEANGSDLKFASGAAGQPIWAELVEKAFAQLNDEPGALHDRTIADEINAYKGINGGVPQHALREITDQSSITYYDNKLVADAATIGAAFNSGEEVELSVGKLPSGYQGDLHPDHVFQVIGYDANTGEFEIHNPWGSATKLPTTFSMTAQQLATYGCSMTVAEGSFGGHEHTHELEASLASLGAANHAHHVLV